MRHRLSVRQSNKAWKRAMAQSVSMSARMQRGGIRL